MATGLIKRVFLEKGFGFIKPDDGSDDLFFHRSTLLDLEFEDLTDGRRVTFEVGQGQKGPRAERVSGG